MATEFEKLNPPREDGFPKVKELKAKVKFVSDRKDLNYELPLSNLYKEY